jgi:probable HAF family extracellular repeat protein
VVWRTWVRFLADLTAREVLGEVVGYSNATYASSLGFVWTKEGGMQALPELPNEVGASANAINDQGEIVGGNGSDAVLWHNDQNHTIENLGTLPGQGWATAFGINDNGQVVGWSGFTAFVWTSKSGMQDLNSLIPPGSGWELSLASAINVRGQITGQGTIHGEQHGFLLTPTSN